MTGRGAGIFLLFTTGLQDGLLGAILTFSSQPLYDAYGTSAAVVGLDPRQDQQLADLLMWIAGGMAWLLAALVLTSLWLTRMKMLESLGKGDSAT